VTATGLTAAAAEQIARSVPDPEMPWVTLGDLGVVAGVAVGGDPGTVLVRLTPTYLGCPATEVIRDEVEAALLGAGWRAARIELSFDPPWTSDRISAEGRAKLAAEGIAPPSRRPGPLFVRLDPPRSSVRCPNCGATETVLLSAFGATPCQELRRCSSCMEPFPAMKADTR
jgi:ring-1,2-phenylacetyl-CoA epoxidase subunit PaaD